MPADRPSKRVIRGALEGALTGFAIAVVRTSIKAFDRGGLGEIGQHIPEIAVFFAASIVGVAYVFAIGRLIANGVPGSLLGTFIFAIGGVFVGSMLSYDSSGTPYPIAAGAMIGVVGGAPVGAFVQRLFSRKAQHTHS